MIRAEGEHPFVILRWLLPKCAVYSWERSVNVAKRLKVFLIIALWVIAHVKSVDVFLNFDEAAEIAQAKRLVGEKNQA